MNIKSSRMLKMLFLVSLIFSSGCSFYGLEAEKKPSQTKNESVSEAEDQTALLNVLTFPITIKEFEENIENNLDNESMTSTTTGIEFKEMPLELNYKSAESNKNDQLEFLYILIDLPFSAVDKKEDQIHDSLEVIVQSLEIELDTNQMVQQIKKKESKLINNDVIRAELANYDENIQIILSPQHSE
ncbi:hypothetical protein [Exiguobacterium sp. SRB7LM]|uniref:hypothetical protein n=1 Tax=Exiguobacterium sp. SRB7LM TaxID=2608401 RepID=UPI0018C449D6|nr:hypothetical protein [Exiguobacterium sp. SRB7LM]MBG0917123.1 hypothetical protein [Exiguobacterium sp. SRB7LM]